ncbi:hypothetical protein IFR05_011105 [Cadophora sp. M221]|nr:hypothetical protein IFR05_011105 [Cadophora sp. M221]
MRCGNLKSIKSLWPHAELHLINYPWQSKHRIDVYTSTIPLENIVFISTYNLKNRQKNFEPLGQVIAQSPKLRVLRLTAGKLLDWKTIKIPPIRELELKGCSWDLTSAEVDLMWNFKHLESLTIDPIVTANSFFSSLQRDGLQELRTITVTAPFHLHFPLIRESLTQHLDHFIAGGHKLEELKLKCNVPLLRITSISNHSELRILNVHDYTGFRYEQEICPSFSVADIAVLGESCSKIRELSLDLDQSPREMLEFVKTLATFRNLQVVKLNMRSLLSKEGINSCIIDTDYEAAKELKSILCLSKAGLPILSLILSIAGYDDPVRPNRDGNAWTLQRQKGHNPERYFAFSWLPDGTEVMTSLARRYWDDLEAGCS